MSQINNGKEKVASDRNLRKPIAVGLAVVILVSSIAGALLIINLSDEKPFFNHPMGGMGYDPNVTWGITVTEPPLLGKETKLIFWENYENASYTIVDSYRLFQIFLPDSIELVNGSRRSILNPGDPMNVTWNRGLFYQVGLCN
jgi:hypothetical protein